MNASEAVKQSIVFVLSVCVFVFLNVSPRKTLKTVHQNWLQLVSNMYYGNGGGSRKNMVTAP